MDLKFYRIDEVPQTVLTLFDRAVKQVSTASRQRGEGQVSQAGAFCALVRAVDLDDAIVAGQALASSHAGKRKDRGFQIPAEVKERLVQAASRKGIKVGAAGRLVMIARAARLTETIEEGIAAERLTATELAIAAPTTITEEVPA